LTKSAIDEFIKWSFEHFDEFEMTISFWESITKRLSGTSNPDWRVSSRYHNQIRPREGFPLDGIISELTRIHGGNVHERGIVNVSANSVHSTNKSQAAQNAVDLGQQNYFYSLHQPNQGLCYDFKDRRIELTDYSIAAHTGNHFLRSWVVEGSSNGSDWTILDEQMNNTTADSNHPIATFSVTGRQACRYIRLRQTGKSSYNHDYLVLYGFEVFGLINA
jgi:hypothetical protein